MWLIEFFDLPLEIRQLIYDYCLENVRLVEYYLIRQPASSRRRRIKASPKPDYFGLFTVSAGNTWPSLLGIDRKVRKETFDFVFAHATFKIACHHPDIILPPSLSPKIQQAVCGLIGACCRTEIYTFQKLRSLTCEVYLICHALREYGYEPGYGPETEDELQAMVISGLDPTNHWTLSAGGYPHVMKLFLDNTRRFKLRVLAHATWARPSPESFKSICTVVHVDDAVSAESRTELSLQV